MTGAAARLLGLCVILGSGCTCGIALCNANNDCGPGGACDPSTGVCVFEGGPGGGSAGGGAGGGSGGGAVGSTLLTIRVPPRAPRPPLDGAVYEDAPAAWRRGEQLFIWLQASRPITSPSLKFGGIDAMPTGVSACVEPCTGNCYCFAADLARPPLPGLRGAFALHGAGIDPDGKPVTAADSINVTRLYWRRPLGQPIRATPAVGVDGTIYVGTSGGSARTGTLFALSFDGKERWKKPLGRIDASVLVAAPGTGPQQLFVGSVASNSAALTAFDASGVQVAQCPLSKDAELEASPASVALGAAFYANNTKELIAFRPSMSAACLSRQTSEDVRYPDSLVATGQAVLFVDDAPKVYRFDLTPTSWWEYAMGQWPGVPFSSYRNRGLAIPNGGKLIGAGEIQSGGAVFQASVGGNFKFDFGFSPPRVSASARGPVVASDGLVLVGIPTGIAAVGSTGTQVGTGDRIANSPALGEGGRLYALAENGSISEWSYAAGKPTRTWTAPLDASATLAFEASPALDCARAGAGVLAAGRPGVLYAGARSGMLHAIIVDARGIDTSAQWPKYQKDPRNSGTGDTGLQEFACP